MNIYPARLAIIAAAIFSFQTFFQTSQADEPGSRKIPVYAGASLEIRPSHDGEQQSCCEFVTHDAYGKVLAFYEQALKTKPMGPKELAARYPALRQMIQQMSKQMPPSMKIQEFVTSEMVFQGKKMPQTFEVTSTPHGVLFNIPDDELTEGDAHFALEWRQKTGTLTDEDRAQMEQQEQNAADTAEATEQDKQDRAHQARMLALFEKDLPRNGGKLYPGAKYLESESSGYSHGMDEANGTPYEVNAYEATYLTSDSFDKVYKFYADGKHVEIGTGGWGGYFQTYGHSASFPKYKCVMVAILEGNRDQSASREVEIQITADLAANKACPGFADLVHEAMSYGAQSQ